MYETLLPWPPLPAPSGPPNLTERLAPILHGLRAAAGARAAKAWLMAPLMMVFAAYLGSVLRRFDLLAARFEAGRLHTRTKRPRLVATKNGACDETPRKPRLSRRFGWVIEVCGYYAAGYAANLRHMLANDTEMGRLWQAPSKRRASFARSAGC